MSDDQVNVILVDDHALFRAGLAVLLSKLNDLGTVSEVGSGQEAMDLLAGNSGYDLMLLDYSLPDMTGIDVLMAVKKAAPELPIILLSASVDTALIQNALALHASGFIPKNSSPDVMLSAIQLVLSGGIYIPLEAIREQGVTAQVHDAESNSLNHKKNLKAQFTQRQMEVLLQMQQGLSNKEIARELNMSPSTVKVHVAAILRLLEVGSRTQAVLLAKESGILD